MIDLEKLVPIPPCAAAGDFSFYDPVLSRSDVERLRTDTAKAVAQRCYELGQEQQDMPECPERAEYCAQAITAEFGLEVQG